MIARMLIKKGLSRQCSTLYKQNRLVYQQRYSFLDQKLFNQDHYKILGVQPGTSKDEIKKQYYRLTKQYHPDINKGNEEKFKQINAAWDVLSDDKKRSEYDQYNGFFGHSNSSSSSAQNGQAFNPFGGFGGNQFGGNQFGGQNPFHSSGMGQNPFGAGSPFEQVDLNQLLKDLKKNGVKLEDMQNSPHFNEFNQMFGLNKEEPKNFKDKVTHKIKQEAIKMMLRKVQDKLEKEIQFHQQQKEKYQQQANGGYSTQGTYNNQLTTSQQNQNTSSQNSNNQRTNQTYYSNKPSGNKSSSNGSVQDTINKASDMFSSFFKKK